MLEWLRVRVEHLPVLSIQQGCHNREGWRDETMKTGYVTRIMNTCHTQITIPATWSSAGAYVRRRKLALFSRGAFGTWKLKSVLRYGLLGGNIQPLE